MSQSDQRQPVQPYHVLFVCSGNSARSIMAECALRRYGGARFVAHSAGSNPRGRVDPTALELLKNLNYKTDTLASKDWLTFAGPDSPPLDFVFTLCNKSAQEVCPVWPGQPMTAHWSHEDPAAVDGPPDKRYAAFKRIYLELENRIKIFANLRLEALDKLSLKARLDGIGNTAWLDTAERLAQSAEAGG